MSATAALPFAFAAPRAAVAGSVAHRPAQPPKAAELVAHRGALLRFARQRVRDEALAEDAVQDALLAAIRSADRFAGQSSLRTWLIGILNHKIQDVFRRETRYVPMAQDDDGEDRLPAARAAGLPGDETEPPAGTGRGADPVAEVAGRRLRAALETEVAALPESLREVFRLQALEGVGTADVCARLGITEANCWVRLHRARKRLAERMAAHLA